MFGFRKNETPIINNTNNVKCEIDYKKLADAIVKAQEQVKKSGTEKEKTKIYVALMAICVTIIFVALFVLCTTFFIIGCIVFYELVISEIWNSMSIKLRCVFSLEYILFLIAVLFFGVSFLFAAREIYKEKDRGFVMSAFSSVIGFAAFIVSLVALFQSSGSKEIIPYLQDIVELLSK